MRSVAVVIPTRDRADLLRVAVGSALAQTYPALSVWVVDDGSVRPVELAPHPRVHVIRLERSSGAGAARNIAVQRSASDYIAFLDDDDAFHPESVARRVEVLDTAPPTVAAVEAGFELWDDGRCVLRYLPDEHRDLHRALLENPCMAPSSVLMRRNVFEAIGGFRADLPRTEDWDLWLRIADRYAVAAVPEVLTIRTKSAQPPLEILGAYRTMVRLLEPRIAKLPPAERRRVTATHLLNQGAYLMAAGRRVEGVACIARAWRVDPSVRTTARAAHAMAGPRLAPRTSGARARLRGVDPLLRRW